MHINVHFACKELKLTHTEKLHLMAILNIRRHDIMDNSESPNSFSIDHNNIAKQQMWGYCKTKKINAPSFFISHVDLNFALI